jgi:type I restriction enzyme, S subunit
MDKFFRTNSSILEERLDPNFYQPSLVSNDELIKSKGWIELNTFYRTSGIGNTSGVERYYSDSADSIPYISGKSIKSFNIDFDGCQRVTVDSHKNELAKSTLKSGDVLVIRKGDMGNACVVPSDVNEANCSSEVIYLKMRDSSEPYFLVSYLNCEQGQKAFKRLGRGTIIPGVSLLDVPFLPVPKFSAITQKYIGDKVRQAEQLRAWAKRLEVKLALLENQIPTSKPVIGEYKHSKATLEFLTENRLDARYYAKKHLDLYAQFNNEFESFGSICSGFKYGASIAANYVNSEGLPFIRGNALSPNRINQEDIVYLSKSLEGELKTAYVEEGDILITRSGTVGVTTYVAAEHAKYWYGSFIIKCKLATNSYLPAYVSWYLNSWVGQQQFRRLENGAVQLNINTEELSSIAIWKAPQEFQTEIDKLLIEQISAVNLSKSLTSAAKTLVEALIEGQLTEQQLIQAQQALDDGDNSLDQAILSKLSHEGYAIEGATPLFSDIDELYRLLESAAQTEAEE